MCDLGINHGRKFQTAKGKDDWKVSIVFVPHGIHNMEIVLVKFMNTSLMSVFKIV